MLIPIGTFPWNLTLFIISYFSELPVCLVSMIQLPLLASYSSVATPNSHKKKKKKKLATPPGLWDLSSLTRDQTNPPAVKALSLNHLITREVPPPTYVRIRILTSYAHPQFLLCVFSLHGLFGKSQVCLFIQIAYVDFTLISISRSELFFQIDNFYLIQLKCPTGTSDSTSPNKSLLPFLNLSH